MISSDFKIITELNVLDIIRTGIQYIITEYDGYWKDYVICLQYIGENNSIVVDVAFGQDEAIRVHREHCEEIGIKFAKKDIRRDTNEN